MIYFIYYDSGYNFVDTFLIHYDSLSLSLSFRLKSFLWFAYSTLKGIIEEPLTRLRLFNRSGYQSWRVEIWLT